jgi:flagellar hook-basal body complex protein FliE
MAVDPVVFGLGNSAAAGIGGVSRTTARAPVSFEGVGKSFNDVLGGALGEVEALQTKADQAIRQVASGRMDDVHQVMVAFEQARLSMQMMVEVRNRLVEAYQEFSRMPL